MKDKNELQTELPYIHKILEANISPIFMIDLNGKVMDANEAAVQLIGFSSEDIINTDFSDYFKEPKKERKSFEEALKNKTNMITATK